MIILFCLTPEFFPPAGGVGAWARGSFPYGQGTLFLQTLKYCLQTFNYCRYVIGGDSDASNRKLGDNNINKNNIDDLE